ncbi:hypothetical protein BTE77_05825 [Ensifer adhaerens]|nr:hypothetical protein BTE77_05825 [Ensifer adhaerens]
MEIKDLVGLEKPATELINRVSDAVGGIAKPWQIRRVARGEADAKKILAAADLEITEMRERAIKRMVLEEEKNQQNIEAITTKAIPHLSDNAKPGDLDEDFVRYLFEKARLVSNEEMQSIWAKILAGEASKAGSFSRRTMDIVSQMRKEDAELFTRLCRNVWILGGEPVPIITETDSRSDDISLSFEELQHLDDIGLINFESVSSFLRSGFRKRGLVTYYGCPVILEFAADQENELQVGHVMLTTSGKDLVHIAGSASSTKAFESVLEFMLTAGVGFSVPIDAKDRYLAL